MTLTADAANGNQASRAAWVWSAAGLIQSYSIIRPPGTRGSLGRRPNLHRLRVGPATYSLLDHLDFVFLCIDGTEGKRDLVARIEDRGLAFIDVGMGLTVGERGLSGVLRTTTSTPAMRDHVWDRNRIPFDSAGAEDAYSTNVQVADLNALAASLAVIRWKRLCGFYDDQEGEHFSTYTVDGNHMLSEEFAPPHCPPV